MPEGNASTDGSAVGGCVKSSGNTDSGVSGAPPIQPIKMRLSTSSSAAASKGGISIKLATPNKSGVSRGGGGDGLAVGEGVVLKRKSSLAAAAFASDSDEEEPEHMPPEAKMKMKNIGRDTPTSAGPNSFGKTKIGFCDHGKLAEKVLSQAASKSHTDK